MPEKGFRLSGLSQIPIFLKENYLFLKNYVTSEGASSHIVLYYQQLSIAHYQVSFDANLHFKLLPIVSSDFNRKTQGSTT